MGRFEVFGVGDHIAINASLAILAAINSDNLASVRDKLREYKGIKKRFDILQKDDSSIVIDDYAHHPTEIRATISSAKKYATLMGLETIIAIWQPHKYSRTIDNLESFKECFDGIDKLVILPVYNIGEKKRDIDFQKHFKKYNPLFADKVQKNSKKIDLVRDKKSFESLDRGLILGLGAGDITYQLRGEL
jgi:UDP-N-acetylmuramate--alanine ligase